MQCVTVVLPGHAHLLLAQKLASIILIIGDGTNMYVYIAEKITAERYSRIFCHCSIKEMQY